MPHSLVLNLLPQADIPVGYLSGRHLHALFLTLVSSVDQDLGDRLHAGDGVRSFSLSPLQVLGNRGQGTGYRETLQVQHKRSIAAGQSCWWRISLLDDALFGHLSKLWLNLNPHQAWHLGSADLLITSILGTPQSTQPWANFSGYSQLYEQASDSDRELRFRFYTPTAFRKGQFDTSMPTQENVFSSLLKRWNEFSGMEFPEKLIEPIFPSYFDIQTEIVQDSRSKFIGCTGSVTYRILGQADAEMIKQINCLANFALYAGVGRKTTMGMGMVRKF